MAQTMSSAAAANVGHPEIRFRGILIPPLADLYPIGSMRDMSTDTADEERLTPVLNLAKSSCLSTTRPGVVGHANVAVERIRSPRLRLVRLLVTSFWIVR